MGGIRKMEAEREASRSMRSDTALTAGRNAKSDFMSAVPAKTHSAVPEHASPVPWSGQSPQWLVDAAALAASAQAFETLATERKAATTAMATIRPLHARCIRRRSLSAMS